MFITNVTFFGNLNANTKSIQSIDLNTIGGFSATNTSTAVQCTYVYNKFQSNYNNFLCTNKHSKTCAIYIYNKRCDGKGVHNV